jgi:hypothetical protein
VLRAGFAKPNLSLPLVDCGWQDSVAVRANASGFSNLFGLGPFNLNGFRFLTTVQGELTGRFGSIHINRFQTKTKVKRGT